MSLELRACTAIELLTNAAYYKRFQLDKSLNLASPGVLEGARQIVKRNARVHLGSAGGINRTTATHRFYISIPDQSHQHHHATTRLRQERIQSFTHHVVALSSFRDRCQRHMANQSLCATGAVRCYRCRVSNQRIWFATRRHQITNIRWRHHITNTWWEHN